MFYDLALKEEELKNRVRSDFFANFDANAIIGNIDFAVAVPNPCTNGACAVPALFDTEYLLWAEAKKGNKENIYHSLVQLILTIGKARTYDHHLPPTFLGAFDAEKIAFLPYHEVINIFYQNDFNWNVTPSNHSTKEFQQVLQLVTDILNRELLLFSFNQEKELRQFIKQNFVAGKENVTKIQITTNNFISIFQKWEKEVKPSIAIDWDVAKKEGIIGADFFLADLLSDNNVSIKESLFVLLQTDKYRYNKQRKASGSLMFEEADFNDGQKAHYQFWNRYVRPPKEVLWEELCLRRDLLVPQDVRERKGSFFTPQIWVEKSQEYLADVLGENWQEEYYIWDCCAGTGNLLNGLKNKYRIFASTLDQQDVNVMRDRIANGANLLENHVFQFDFLNDDFLPCDKGGKLPPALYNIIAHPEQRKKLVVYINPPYAEATTATTVTGTGKNKAGTAIDNKTYLKYKREIGKASNELFAQFFIRIYKEIEGCMLAEFSTLKILQAPNFSDFRKIFRPKLEKMFVVPAATFDNVKGAFPIGFFIWNTDKKETFTEIETDVYERNGKFCGTKKLYCEDNKSINNWLKLYSQKQDILRVGLLDTRGNDFQNQKYVYLIEPDFVITAHSTGVYLTQSNLLPISVYFAVRLCIEATWLNDRDQFLYPNEGWQADREFQADCLAFALFHGQNRISGAVETRHATSLPNANHWIPFTEAQVEARDAFATHFMSDFIAGKLPAATSANSAIGTQTKMDFSAPMAAEDSADYNDGTMFTSSVQTPYNGTQAVVFSEAAQAVYDAGLALWRYYHQQPTANPNAAFYDIRRHFQGVSVGKNGKERMNNDSQDETYNVLIKDLREKMKILAKKIEPKVYEYGFLR